MEKTDQEAMDGDCSRLYPFCLAYQLNHEVSELGDRDGWLAELTPGEAALSLVQHGLLRRSQQL